VEILEIKNWINTLWILISAGLVFFMQVGFLSLETGLTRRKNNANVAAKNLVGVGIAIALFWLFGFGLMFGASGGDMGLFGTTRIAPDLSNANVLGSGLSLTVFFLFQAMFCGTVVTIISGATAERLRFESYLIISIVVAGLIYPIFGHWVWAGLESGDLTGWLGRRGFVDFAGSTVVHSIGGWSALAVLLLIKPRKGRFTADGKPIALPKSSIPMAAMGTLMLWFGWFGFNGGSALLTGNNVALILTNLLIAGSAGLLATIPVRLLLTNGIIETEYLMNGILAGAVAVTASSHAITPHSAFIIGMIAAWIMMSVDALLLRLQIDDVVGAIPVHLGAGIWGTLAVALFGDPERLGTGLNMIDQLTIQSIGIAVSALWSFIIMLICLNTIDQFFPLRVTTEEEEIGLNISEQGIEPDYSEFPRLTEMLEKERYVK